MDCNNEKGAQIYPRTGQKLPEYPELQAIRNRALHEKDLQTLSINAVQEELIRHFGYSLSEEVIAKLALQSDNWVYSFQDNDLPIIFAQFAEGNENYNAATALIILNRAIRNNTVVASSLSISGIAEMDQGDIPRALSLTYGSNGYLSTIDIGLYEDEFPDPHPAPGEVQNPETYDNPNAILPPFTPFSPKVMSQIRDYNSVTRPLPTPVESKGTVITPEMTHYNPKIKALHLFFPHLGNQQIPFEYGIPYASEYPSRWGNQYMQGHGYGVLLHNNTMHVSRLGRDLGDWQIAIPISLEHLPPADQS